MTADSMNPHSEDRTPVLLLSEENLAESPRQHAAGERPHELTYGAECLTDFGYQPVFHERQLPRLLRKPRDVIEHRSGVPVAEPLLASLRGRKAEITLATLERFARLPGLLKSIPGSPYHRKPLTMFSCWIGERARSARSPELEELRKWCRPVDRIMVWSKNQIPLFEDLLGTTPGQVVGIPFGIDADFFQPRPDEKTNGRLLSVGQDTGRDYRALFAAVRGSKWQLDVLANRASIEGLDIPTNVTYHGHVDKRSYRDWLARAELVVIATKDLAYPTGQTVFLEAMAMAKPCIVTNTDAMSEYLTDTTSIQVPIDDVDALRLAIERAMTDQDLRQRIGAAARPFITEHFTAQHMWRRVAMVLDSLPAR